MVDVKTLSVGTDITTFPTGTTVTWFDTTIHVDGRLAQFQPGKDFENLYVVNESTLAGHSHGQIGGNYYVVEHDETGDATFTKIPRSVITDETDSSEEYSSQDLTEAQREAVVFLQEHGESLSEKSSPGS